MRHVLDKDRRLSVRMIEGEWTKRGWRFVKPYRTLCLRVAGQNGCVNAALAVVDRAPADFKARVPEAIKVDKTITLKEIAIVNFQGVFND